MTLQYSAPLSLNIKFICIHGRDIGEQSAQIQKLPGVSPKHIASTHKSDSNANVKDQIPFCHKVSLHPVSSYLFVFCGTKERSYKLMKEKRDRQGH